VRREGEYKLVKRALGLIQRSQLSHEHCDGPTKPGWGWADVAQRWSRTAIGWESRFCKRRGRSGDRGALVATSAGWLNFNPQILTVPLISHPTLPSPSPSHTHHTHTHTHTSVSLAELLWPTSSHSHFASLLHLKYHPLLHNTRGSFLLHFASCSVGKLILSQPALLPSVWHGAIRCLSCVTLRHRLPSTSTSIFSSCGLSPRCG
jgi:hypothetical protein